MSDRSAIAALQSQLADLLSTVDEQYNHHEIEIGSLRDRVSTLEEALAEERSERRAMLRDED